MIFFNARAFVIPTCKSLIYDSQVCAHIFEDAIEPNVGANVDNRNHAEQENDILHEKFREMFCMCLCGNIRDYKLS